MNTVNTKTTENNTKSNLAIWPPEYTICYSNRAKHLQLKISNNKGLQVIVPKRCRNPNITALLETNKKWIHKHLSKIDSTEQRALKELEFPVQMKLLALNQTWQVEYVQSTNRLKLLERPHQMITLFGNIEKKPCLILLKKWLQQTASKHFTAWMHELSQEMNLYFSGLTIRGQKTRWGSCSHQKNINLNYKLLFLPYSLVRHTMIHELCHLKFLNHSKRFWRLVEKYDPDWKTSIQQFKTVSQYVPLWLDAS